MHPDNFTSGSRNGGKRMGIVVDTFTYCCTECNYGEMTRFEDVFYCIWCRHDIPVFLAKLPPTPKGKDATVDSNYRKLLKINLKLKDENLKLKRKLKKVKTK